MATININMFCCFFVLFCFFGGGGVVSVCKVKRCFVKSSTTETEVLARLKLVARKPSFLPRPLGGPCIPFGRRTTLSSSCFRLDGRGGNASCVDPATGVKSWKHP